MLANINGLAAPTPPAVLPPTPRTLPGLARTAPPTSDALECSTSPTNTSGSDVSGLSSTELAAILLAGQQNAAVKQEFPDTHVKPELPPMANPLFGMSDAAALLQFLQAQQAVAQWHKLYQCEVVCVRWCPQCHELMNPVLHGASYRE
ncbi:hypothetical protein COOONC_06348 [Cooperia oncophora]